MALALNMAPGNNATGCSTSILTPPLRQTDLPVHRA